MLGQGRGRWAVSQKPKLIWNIQNKCEWSQNNPMVQCDTALTQSPANLKNSFQSLKLCSYCLHRPSLLSCRYVFFIFQMEENMSSKSIAGLAGGIVMPAGYFLPSQNSLHSATPPLVSSRNDVCGMSAEMPYWLRDALQIWVVLLIGRVNLLHQVRSITPVALVSQTSFRGETSGDVAKCRLFSWRRGSRHAPKLLKLLAAPPPKTTPIFRLSRQLSRLPI